MQIDEIQFDIIMCLPKTAFLTFEEFDFRLENALIAYQQCFNPNMSWYLFKNIVKVKPDELVHNTAGFTDFDLKNSLLLIKRLKDLSLSLFQPFYQQKRVLLILI